MATQNNGISTEDLMAASYHEAGHAVIAYRFGSWVRDNLGGSGLLALCIRNDGTGWSGQRRDLYILGNIAGWPENSVLRHVFAYQRHRAIQCSLAGLAAEVRLAELTSRKSAVLEWFLWEQWPPPFLDWSI